MNIKLWIKLGVGIGLILLIVFTLLYKSSSNNVKNNCRMMAKILEPIDMKKQQQAYEAELQAYYYMLEVPDSKLKEMIVEFYNDDKLNYLIQALEYDNQIESFNKMRNLHKSKLKTSIIDKYPNNYNEQLLNYNKQSEILRKYLKQFFTKNTINE